MSDIEVKGLAHIGIPTSDLETSIAFYRNLGFQTIVYKKRDGRQ